MTIEFENGLNDIKTTLVDYHDRQEKKLNQLWAAVGRSGGYAADANGMENDRELRSFLREGVVQRRCHRRMNQVPIWYHSPFRIKFNNGKYCMVDFVVCPAIHAYQQMHLNC